MMINSLAFEVSPLTLALGWTIVHTLWQAVVVVIGLKLLLSLFSNQLSNLRYIVSCFALIICMVWAASTFHQEWQLHQKYESILDETPIEQPLLTQLIENELHNQNFWNVTTSNQWKLMIGNYIPMIAFFWFLGALFSTYWLFYGFLQLHQLQKKGLYPTPNEWNLRLKKLCEQMGISKSVQLLISNKVEGPITFRLFKPVILLPIQLLTGLSTAQIEVLLLHELAHIRRFDYAVNLCQSIIEVLLFYHPAIWWINRQIRQEREHCCDDLVLQIQNKPHLYAHSLTNAQVNYSSLKTKLAMSANQEQGHLTTRIHRLFGNYEYSVVSIKGIFIALLLVMGLLIQEISAQKNIPSNISEIELLADNTEATPLEEPTLVESSKENDPKSATKEERNGLEDILPKNPEPGKCYEKIKAEDKYKSVTKEYLIYTGDVEKAPKGVTKMILETTPATTKWVKKSSEGCMSENPEDCMVWCAVDVPAQTETVLVLKDETQSDQFEQKSIKNYVLKKNARDDFIEVLCEKQITKNVITQIQRALKPKGFNAGNSGNTDKQFYEGLVEFQNANNLPIGKLDIQTMELLGIHY